MALHPSGGPSIAPSHNRPNVVRYRTEDAVVRPMTNGNCRAPYESDDLAWNAPGVVARRSLLQDALGEDRGLIEPNWEGSVRRLLAHPIRRRERRGPFRAGGDVPR
jgi:hypothetical protein